jgi:hypothetical protein
MSMWRATYLDDTTLLQKFEGHEVSSETIDRSRIKKMELILDGGVVVAILQIDAGQNFFYRRRVRMFNGHTQICHVLGRLANGMVDGEVIFHLDEGTVTYNNGFNENNPWFYPVNFRPCELQ